MDFASDNIDNLKVGMVFFPDSAKKVVLNKVRDLPRCKSVKLSDIGSVWRVCENGWMNFKAKVRGEDRRFASVDLGKGC